ncbi:MAG: MarR family transcriptional regulator [Betaproteobacteria bacterium]|nr:MarR family transcriptional regulator [Betaproteobacteria bacterium]
MSRLARLELGLEARAQREDHLDTRMWLRLLACSADIEQAIRQRLRLQFGTTLSRFDYLAQLQRHPKGLRMSELSACLMVTGGNVTGLTDQLVLEGWVQRTEDIRDRRVWRVRLTAEGRRRFEQMATEHEGWLRQLFKPMQSSEKKALFELLGQLREHLQAPPDSPAKPALASTAAWPFKRDPNPGGRT